MASKFVVGDKVYPIDEPGLRWYVGEVVSINPILVRFGVNDLAIVVQYDSGEIAHTDPGEVLFEVGQSVRATALLISPSGMTIEAGSEGVVTGVVGHMISVNFDSGVEALLNDTLVVGVNHPQVDEENADDNASTEV